MQVRTVPEMFESVVATAGDAPAVAYRGRTRSYAGLNAAANRLARRLVGLGIGPDRIVAVAVPRSDTMVIALLAVLKAGGAYLPLDPAYPAARLARMIDDARPVLLVRTADVPVRAPGMPEVVLDTDPGDTGPDDTGPDGTDLTDADRCAPLHPDHLMYVIYTSGSTGVPKGVAVTHRGVPDLVATQAAWIGAGPGDRVLQWASISFDAAFWDLTLALLSGATLVVADAADLLPGEPLHATLAEQAITHAVLPPVALSVTDSTAVLAGGVVMSTGDVCTGTLADKWARGRRMFNGYGPTEVTVGATIAGPVEPGAEVTIGEPWVGDTVHVLDERLAPVPDGEDGELYLSGPGLARGYLGRPGATAERFLPDPLGAPGSRMYRTGDRGHRGPDGTLHFAGRTDAQVKIRGFRVEPGEVEACLAAHPQVDLAGVVVRGDLSRARLAAFVTSGTADDPDPDDLRRHVAAMLPEHMVPATVTVLDALPATVNGKIDRAALRDRAAGGQAARVPAPDPAPLESALCGLVADLLETDEVRPTDNFFDLGGHSVLAAHLVRRMRAELKAAVPMRAVFEAADLAELARGAGQRETSSTGSRL